MKDELQIPTGLDVKKEWAATGESNNMAADHKSQT
jgi:hypothetical protein